MFSNKTKLLLGVSAMFVLTACNSSDDPAPRQNTAPKPVSQMLVTTADTELKAGLFAFDDEKDSLSFSVATAPENGSLTINSDGAFSYVPNAEYVGTDSFSFSVSDGKLSATGTINIRIDQLQVSLRSSVRNAFVQEAQSTPLAVNGRAFAQDVLDTAEFDDLVVAGEVGNNE